VRAAIALALWACLEAAIHACPICFQVEDGPVVDGVRAAVGVLMGVTGVVLVGCAAFFTRLARRQ
jgi:hypothetical protein